MSHTVRFPNEIRCTVDLPRSKSLSARALVLAAQAGCGEDFLRHLADCDDTRSLRHGLQAWRDAGNAALHGEETGLNAGNSALHVENTGLNAGSAPLHVDIGAAGTAMRFLTAFFAAAGGMKVLPQGAQSQTDGGEASPDGLKISLDGSKISPDAGKISPDGLKNSACRTNAPVCAAGNPPDGLNNPASAPCGVVLCGSERMHQRPIGLLVEALRAVGAKIEHLAQEGFPPLHIVPRTLEGGEICMPADVSSQYVSALLMAAPAMRKGLVLRLTGEVLSAPYIAMTVALLRRFGAVVRTDTGDAVTARTREICVAPATLRLQEPYEVECDWSAASYWYEIVALTPDAGAQVLLRGLRMASEQGDRACATLFEALGVQTEAVEEGLLLTKNPAFRIPSDVWDIDLRATPDLVQTLAVTCAVMGRQFRFSGVRSLRIKETDRLAALQTELARLHLHLDVEGDDVLAFRPKTSPDFSALPPVRIQTYRDHRMALAFAPVALRIPSLTVEDEGVISKSYPDFWQQIAHL